MHIAVIVRIVPDLSDELEIADSNVEIDREWIGLKLNEFDDHALEEAILIKEVSGARVTAVALTGDGAQRQLQTAIARGADDAVLAECDLGDVIDSRVAALALKPVLESLGADVVMTGVQTPEDVFGQLASYLAGALGWPVVNAVNGAAPEDGALAVTQEYSGGFATRFAVDGPVVLGIQAASKPPRYVSGSKLRQASSLSIPATAVSLPEGVVARELAELREPERGAGAEMMDGTAEQVAEKLVGMLAKRGLVGG